jgi:hypothetical protein
LDFRSGEFGSVRLNSSALLQWLLQWLLQQGSYSDSSQVFEMRSTSESQKKGKSFRDVKECLVIRAPKLRDQSLFRYRLDVFAFRVRDLAEFRCLGIKFDVRRKTATSSRARNDDHDSRATLVESVCRNDDCGTTAGLFGTDRISKVDEPDVSSVRRHVEES